MVGPSHMDAFARVLYLHYFTGSHLPAGPNQFRNRVLKSPALKKPAPLNEIFF